MECSVYVLAITCRCSHLPTRRRFFRLEGRLRFAIIVLLVNTMIKSPSNASSSPATRKQQQYHTPLRLRSRAISSAASATRSDDELDNEDDDNDHHDYDEPESPSNKTNEDDNEDEQTSDGPPEQYRDFYLSSTHEIKVTLGTPPPKRKGPRGGVTSAFPVKLHEMLSRCQFEGAEHIVSWLPHGRAFTVHQPSIFVEELMPRYFKQSKMTSFQRQLNLYGFMRKTDGTDRGSYYHELFLRGRPDLAKIMVRTRVKGDCKRRAMVEPDFYKMPFCPDDPDPRQQSPHHHHRHHHLHHHLPPPPPPPLPPPPPPPHKARSPERRHYYKDGAAETPRAGYSSGYYYSGQERGSEAQHEDSSSTPVSAEVTPYSQPRVYPSGTRHLRTSSFFLDEEPILHAPEDSEWTPPPFPDFRHSQQPRRERPPPQIIQPSYYPNIVSPDPGDHNRSNATCSLAPSSDICTSSRRAAPVRRLHPPPPPPPPPSYHQSPESREEHAEYHYYRRRYRGGAVSSRSGREHRRWIEDRYGSHPYYYRPYYYRQYPFRPRGGVEGGVHRNQYFEGQHFEPVDDTSLDLYETDIHYV